MNGQNTDKEILELISSDLHFDKGFKLLVETFQERLYWHIRRMVHIHADADDVLQDMFIKVALNIRSFDGKAKLYTWLYRIATNQAIDHLNKKKRQLSVSGEDTFDRMVADDPYFDGEKVQIALKKAIDTLPDKQRVVFNLRYYDEMTYKEMSEVTATSVGALKASYHHAVKKIEHYITERALEI